jgi:hypothetical protein
MSTTITSNEIYAAGFGAGLISAAIVYPTLITIGYMIYNLLTDVRNFIFGPISIRNSSDDEDESSDKNESDEDESSDKNESDEDESSDSDTDQCSHNANISINSDNIVDDIIYIRNMRAVMADLKQRLNERN